MKIATAVFTGTSSSTSTGRTGTEARGVCAGRGFFGGFFCGLIAHKTLGWLGLTPVRLRPCLYRGCVNLLQVRNDVVPPELSISKRGTLFCQALHHLRIVH